MPSHAPRGTTLVELAFVLALLAVGASAIAPTARRLGDRAAVVAVREDVVRALNRARARAIAAGGSSVTVLSNPPTARLRVAGRAVGDTPLGSGRDVDLELSGGRDSTTLRFDRLGIGRFANATVVLRRGDAEARLVVSTYGRVRRR